MPECIRQVNAILAEDPRVLTLVTTGPSTPIDAFAIPYGHTPGAQYPHGCGYIVHPATATPVTAA